MKRQDTSEANKHLGDCCNIELGLELSRLPLHGKSKCHGLRPSILAFPNLRPPAPFMRCWCCYTRCTNCRLARVCPPSTFVTRACSLRRRSCKERSAPEKLQTTKPQPQQFWPCTSVICRIPCKPCGSMYRTLRFGETASAAPACLRVHSCTRTHSLPSKRSSIALPYHRNDNPALGTRPRTRLD